MTFRLYCHINENIFFISEQFLKHTGTCGHRQQWKNGLNHRHPERCGILMITQWNLNKYIYCYSVYIYIASLYTVSVYILFIISLSSAYHCVWGACDLNVVNFSFLNFLRNFLYLFCHIWLKLLLLLHILTDSLTLYTATWGPP